MDVLYEKPHNTLNSAEGRGTWPHASPGSNLPHAGTGKETEEQGWAGQGPDTQFRVLVEYESGTWHAILA